MGIVKITDDLHEQLRKVSGVMSRSMNAQADFSIKIGMLAELNPNKTFVDLIAQLCEEQAIEQVPEQKISHG